VTASGDPVRGRVTASGDPVGGWKHPHLLGRELVRCYRVVPGRRAACISFKVMYISRSKSSSD
jgi:hypothetical protein